MLVDRTNASGQIPKLRVRFILKIFFLNYSFVTFLLISGHFLFDLGQNEIHSSHNFDYSREKKGISFCPMSNIK